MQSKNTANRRPVFALVDCNNFFVSCERVFRPDLWRKPVAVLSNNDGCIVARSNEVKALGVPMGVPVFKVRDTLEANSVTLFSGNFSLYGDFSQRVVGLLQAACPVVEVYSVDESFLDVSTLDIADYEQWARELGQKILQWTGIPVSIGVAPTKTLAKAAAEFAKKNSSLNGAYSVIDPVRREQLLEWLAVGDIWGVGRRSVPKLRQVGIATANQLVKASDGWVQSTLSIRGLKTVKELRGEPCFEVDIAEEPQQSIARTRMFGHIVRSYHELEGAIATFAAQAAVRLRSQQEVAGSVAVFVRTAKQYADRTYKGTVVPLAQPSADTGAVIEAALQGLQRIYDPELGYKKGGVVLMNLKPADAQQLSWLGDAPSRLDQQTDLMRAVDQLNKKFGVRMVRHASEHPERTQWHSRHDRRSPGYTTSWHGLRAVR